LRNGVLSRERVKDLQRARVLTAMTELVRERGVRSVAVAHVVSRSGVSRRTFYELFDDREGCLLAAFEHALQRACEMVLPAYQAAGGWQEQVRAGLAAGLEFLDTEPAMGGLCVVDAFAAEGVVLERRARVVSALIDAVHRGRRDLRPAPPRIVAEGAVGAVLAVVHARMTEPNPKPLSGLLGPLTSMIVLPYLGSDAAARELARPARRRKVTRARRPSADLLRELDMRLTYRTVRVLLAISELGGQGLRPSSRQVADASGVTDQGQISKLLWRLESLGLIANDALTSGRGEPNAWSLTALGRELEQSIRAQTGHTETTTPA
jgi:AcrR family transcriptional regulator